MSSRYLFVLRHAKSSWDDPGLSDRERPLAPRGRHDAKLLADYVRDNEIAPTMILCSPARRTIETLEGVAPAGETLVEPSLYAATAADILNRLHEVPSELPSVMIIGHNPAMQLLVLTLAHGGVAGAKDKFPTGALATLRFKCAWRELGRGNAELVGFIRPKDLR